MSEAFTGVEGGFRRETAVPDGPPPDAPPQPKPREVPDGLSSVEIDTTAKGEPKVRVKVYARSNEPTEVQRAIDHGIDLYKHARGQLHPPLPSSR